MATPHYRPKYATAGQPQYKLSEAQLDLIEQLSVYQCTTEEMAYAVGVCRQTFVTMAKRDPELQKRIAFGQAAGRRALRMVQFKVALSGNANMLIWLGEAVLDQIEACRRAGGGGGGPLEISEETKQHLIALARHLNAVATLQASRSDEDVDAAEMEDLGRRNGNGNGKHG